MKITPILFFFAFSTFSVYSQINREHNTLRIGDQIIKQQVEYKDPGESGDNQFWDFSDLTTINPEYKLTYSSPPLQGDSLYIMGNYTFKKTDVSDDELIVGTEHNTMYYFRIKDDSLLLLGHENPTVKLQYTEPFFMMPYPLSAGQVKNSAYQTKGLYSGTVKIQTHGDIILLADAYGKMVLPTGDTLSPVLRIKTIHTIGDVKDNIKQPVTKRVETHRWYTKGYRYPVFETIRNIDITTSEAKELFKTAFYYPPQEHLYIDTDPENLAILEQMWDMESQTNNTKTNSADDLQTKTVSLEDIMDCKIYPNPAESQLYMEYELKQDAKVSFQLFTIGGNPVKLTNPKQRTTGTYSESIDCSNLRANQYVLRITANSVFVNQVIIKK